ncbi:MAG: outer membrane protein transport protein [Bacteroidia bacterium]|nr:outer membrane protein transport protein [Bacteroidia bacterium]
MKRIGFVLICLSLLSITSQAQVIEDALRLAPSPTLVNPRSAGMGNAFTGLADDASAIYWNPAGLGQLRLSEFSFGLSNVGMNNDASLLGVSASGDNSSTVISNLQFALPFPVARGSFVLGAGYSRIADYTGALSVDAYNPLSSMQTSLYNADNEDLDFAWNLGLEDTLVLTYQDQGRPGWLAIPVTNRVQQTIDLLEDGSLNLWSFGGSIEVAPNAMIGLALNVVSGSYRFERTFIETDIQNAHTGDIIGIDNVTRTDFQSLEIEELIDQDLSGWNMRLGFLYNYRDKARIGIAVQTAGSINVNEDYEKFGRSVFSNASLSYELTALDNNYDISTPAVYSIGASYNPVEWITVAADFDLVDYSKLEFEDSNNFNTTQLNRDIRKFFRSTNNFRAGGEVRVPNTGLILRGGFGYNYSPYSEDEGTTEYNITTFSGGVGYLFEGNFAVNAAFSMSSYNTFVFNYIDPDTMVPESAFTTEQEVTRTRLMLGVTYRF